MQISEINFNKIVFNLSRSDILYLHLNLFIIIVDLFTVISKIKLIVPSKILASKQHNINFQILFYFTIYNLTIWSIMCIIYIHFIEKNI